MRNQARYDWDKASGGLKPHDPWKPGQRLPAPAAIEYVAGVATIVLTAIALIHLRRHLGGARR